MTVSTAPRSGRFPTLAKYDVLDELGHGGMATVYRARDRRLNRDVAVKVIHPHLRDSREVAHRFAVEAQAVAKLRHPNIVEVYDVSSEDEPEQYLVVELLRGLTLRKLLQRHGAMPPEVAAAIGVDLLGAIAHAHAAGVIHRDIKPENVMIEHAPSQGDPGDAGPRPSGRVTPAGADDARAIVKLTDFGIAKLLDGNGMTSTGQVLGSPAHMAPEQIEGGAVDPRSDVFGIGVLLYECMVGHLPFEGNNPAQVLRRVLEGVYPAAEAERPSIGKVWSGILDRALARKPEDRFADASAMREAIVAEIHRLGLEPVHAILLGYCDDPEGFAASHEKKMIARLCDLASAARKRGDALVSAADYNRALAYAPHDPALLRIVTQLHRSEANRRLARRALPMALAVIAMGACAFFVTRALRSGGARADVVPKAEGSAVVATAEAPSASASSQAIKPAPSASMAVASARPAVSTGAPPVVASAPHPTVATVGPPTPKPGPREIPLQGVQPPTGVVVSIDEGPPVDVDERRPIVLDTQAHTLVFSCRKDSDGNSVCDNIQRQVIAAGTQAEPINVRLHIKDARLRVDGDPKRRYDIEEYPNVHVLVGDDTVIPLTREASVWVTIVERGETDRSKRVQLVAGHQKFLAF